MTTLAIALTYVLALAVLGVVIVLVRRHDLRERYAATWLLLGLGMLVLALARPVLDELSLRLGIQSGVTTLVVLSLLVILAVLLQLSVSISRLERSLQTVAEALALHVVETPPALDEADDAHGEGPISSE